MSWRAFGDTRPLPMGASSRYLRSRDSAEGGHLVRLSSGVGLRVLPDGHASGQMRIRTIVAALTELEGGHVDAVVYLRARLGGVAVVEDADGTEELSAAAPMLASDPTEEEALL